MAVRSSLLLLGGIGQAAVAWLYLEAYLGWLLDEFTTDTVLGTIIQIVPSLLFPLVFTYPIYLFLKKRMGDAIIFSASTIISFVIIGRFILE